MLVAVTGEWHCAKCEGAADVPEKRDELHLMQHCSLVRIGQLCWSGRCNESASWTVASH